MGTTSGRLSGALPEGPFIHEPSDQMLRAIGRFSLAWSTLEIGLDLCAVMAFHHFGGKEIENGAPKAMSRKIRMVRKCFNRSDRLTPHREPLNKLLDDLAPIGNFRQQIAHGVGTADRSGGKMIFVRLIHDAAGFHTGHGALIDLDEVQLRSSEAYAIAHGLLGIGLMLARQVAPPGLDDEIDKAARELGG